MASAASLLIQPAVIVLMRRLGAIDVPSARSSHLTPVVRGGGLGVAGSICIATGLAGVDRRIGLVLLSVVMATMIGLVEDVYGISVAVRLALMSIAAVPIAAVGWEPGRSTASALPIALASIIWAISIINAVNFMDGINGISAATGFAAGIAYGAELAAAGDWGAASVGFAVAGASAGFAPWNVPRARVFLGDCGSYALGIVLAGLSILALRRGVAPELVVAPLAVYLVDTGTTLVRRVRARQQWYAPHRLHVYQRLTDRGWTHAQVSFTVLGLVSTITVLAWIGTVSLQARLICDAIAGLLLCAYLVLPHASRRASPQ